MAIELFTPTPGQLYPNSSAQLVKANFRDANNNLCDPVAIVSWATSNASVATVTPITNNTSLIAPNYQNKATVTAIGTGTATITATSQSSGGETISATIPVVVNGAGPASMEIDPQD